MTLREIGCPNSYFKLLFGLDPEVQDVISRSPEGNVSNLVETAFPLVIVHYAHNDTHNWNRSLLEIAPPSARNYTKREVAYTRYEFVF